MIPSFHHPPRHTMKVPAMSRLPFPTHPMHTADWRLALRRWRRMFGACCLAASAIAAADLPPDSLELYAFGASHHTNRNVPWREINPGIGLGLAHTFDPAADILVSAGTYRDSVNNAARFAMIGGRFVAGDRDGFNATAGLSLGYFRGSGWDGRGCAVMPVLSVGYGPVSLCMTGEIAPNRTPANHDRNHATTSVVAIFARVTLWRF